MKAGKWTTGNGLTGSRKEYWKRSLSTCLLRRTCVARTGSVMQTTCTENRLTPTPWGKCKVWKSESTLAVLQYASGDVPARVPQTQRPHTASEALACANEATGLSLLWKPAGTPVGHDKDRHTLSLCWIVVERIWEDKSPHVEAEDPKVEDGAKALAIRILAYPKLLRVILRLLGTGPHVEAEDPELEEGPESLRQNSGVSVGVLAHDEAHEAGQPVLWGRAGQVLQRLGAPLHCADGSAGAGTWLLT